MNLTLRTLGLAMLLLLLFLGATLSLQWWLARETRQLQGVAVEEQRTRLTQILTLSGRQPENWDACFHGVVGAMLGGTVRLLKPEAQAVPLPRESAPGLSFLEDLPGAPGWRVQVQFSPPALMRVQIMHQRTLAVIVLLSLMLATVPLLLVLMSSRPFALLEGVSRAPWAAARAQAAGVEHFAKISNERTVALAQEHGARLRAEEDLQVNRTLLGNSVAERVRLGRELHDNICQTLYAVCLTLESVQKKNTLAPEMAQRVDLCMTELRRLNQEVRTYLQRLEPAQVNGQAFTEAVTDMLASFRAMEGIRIEQRLDEETAALIPSHQTADILNILREAVSNSLRHGHSKHITLLAGRSDQEIALAVHDDGAGFTATGRSSGHGLDNMQARAAALGGRVHVESTPGKGTRVLLTLPVASAS